MDMPMCVFDIVARVESVEETGMVGYKKKSEILKFAIQDNDGRKFECIARGDQIMRLRPMIKINEMIHIKKFIARKDSLGFFLGKAPILTIDHSTIVKLTKDEDEPRPVRFGAPPSTSWGSLLEQDL